MAVLSFGYAPTLLFQGPAKHLTRVRIVIDDQHRRACLCCAEVDLRGQIDTVRSCGHSHTLILHVGGQFNCKCGSVTRFTCHSQLTAHYLAKPATDGQAQASALRWSRGRSIALHESLKE